jgi:hypothetical protein
MAIGIATEAIELLGAVKTIVIYGKEADYENIVEELGDTEFYLRGFRERLSISREETLDHNIAKLTKRYGKTYSNEAAIARADKNTVITTNGEDRDD